jgi:hypothetical protein
MSRAYNVIDADGHILEPLDLWDKYMDPKFRDGAPHLVKGEAPEGALAVVCLDNSRDHNEIGPLGPVWC